VTFNANTGSGDPMAAQDIAYGTPTKLSANTYEKGGNHFVGWNTQSDGQGISYTDKQLVTLRASIELFAQWEADTP